ncbi:PadR family transcriptional regulator [Bacillus amyloliquefaciens]|uniref:PadR family transcriptional regulator n=2 Tax=Bacillus TaxID=1386 RepID=A0A6A8LHW4_BACVE|nr:MULTISPECIES: PadR family transcriptional regulator [Bacillus]AHC41351.1 PadR family transcriptional regulator [Bacillus amyloliquefaciens LFB112]AKD28896.1 transcriptional regulator [Bacillus velezensis NJN-6]APB81320.1 PadR family transcriptional regulator [Bacillus amyloliquefaciens]AWM82326.1 PadR family transcriptional regulator [Bacillus velezensis]MBB4875696.1 DNA-binding PadR family transcriptional regulator [Bacillus velezensis]
MRILKYAILGLLRKGELSGYDISSYFKEELGQFWSAKHSQIYPELKKLTAEGFITFRTAIQGTKLEKKMYTLTDKGELELAAWLTKKDPIPETVKDEFMLKAYFISALTQEEADELFTDQLVKRQEKLSDLENSYQELLTSSAEADSFSSPDFGHYLVLTKALERERNYISWLEDILALIKKA